MYVLDDKRKEYNRQYWLKRKQELSKPTECRLCKKTVPMMPGKKYCSSACANRANGPAKAHGLSKERFYEKVQKTEGCWLWLGSITRGGYGSYTLKSYKGTTRAHRIAYLLEYGPFDPKLFVCHRCDNPPCVRPEHLFLGTRQDNTDDMMRKGRHWRQRMNLRWAGAT